jgi:ATP-dependent RNA helicase SUPV3L1/SUV3
VQARLDLWLKTHIEKLLGPLFDLSKAEDITGIARGIAFQLIESLGVLERAKIAAEMKDLDQPSRATLRKYGVRFGAYHIYLPALLKPAARSLASLLWALKQDNVEMSALSGAQHLAGSGRTSFPVDKQLPRDAYRVLGYRQCGERAVRVDILERLADLIRPALAWRETSPGEKPPGAFDGRGFVVTQAMTSLTGSAGEDFASILRALGYRMERRAPPPPKPAVIEAAASETAPAEAAPAEAASQTLSEAAAVEAAVAGADIVPETTPAEAEGVQTSEVFHRSPSVTLLPDIAFGEPTPVEEPAPIETRPEPVAAPEQPAAMETPPAHVAEPPSVTETTSQADPVSEAAVSEVATVSEADAAPETAAEPELVDVWRPGGRSEERRPRQHDRNRHRHQERSAPGEQAAAAAGEGGEAAKGERHRRGRRDRHRDSGNPRPDAPAEAVAANAGNGAPAREERTQQPRERFQGKDRNEDRNNGKFRGDRDNGGRDKGGRENRGGRDKGGRDRDKGGRDNGPSHRQYATSASSRERDRPIDPNSPFAKLAALKEQLAGNRKE